MNRLKAWIVAALALLMLSSCSEVEEQPPLVLSTDTWIGASPLYYAHAMGWLEEADIELLQADSIYENLEHFRSKAADIVTGTVHEYKLLKAISPDLIPIIIYDRSYGGDVILSNRTVSQICQSKERINVYIEKDTVSEEMWHYFTIENNLSTQRYTLYDRNQNEIEQLSASPLSPPAVIVTYNPHDSVLKKQGFMEIASSKNESYIIVDAIYVSSRTAAKHSDQIHALKDIVGKAVRAYHRDPKKFYETVKPYLDNLSYQEFVAMVHNIQWMEDKALTPGMLQQLEKNEFLTKELLP